LALCVPDNRVPGEAQYSTDEEQNHERL
jgi:hypothetical protein